MAHVLVNVRGHGIMPDASVPALQAAVTRISDLAAEAGFPLRVDCVVTEPDTPAAIPIVSSVVPASAVCGGPDVTLHVHGTGFVGTSVILFNAGAEPTTYVSATEVTTVVKPSLASAAITVPVSVAGATTAADFTFTLAPGTQAASVPRKG